MNGTTIPFTLRVLDINNNKYQVYCLGDIHTVEYVKYVLQYYININRDNMDLYVGPTRLFPWNTLRYYNINRDTTLRLYCKLNTGIVY